MKSGMLLHLCYNPTKLTGGDLMRFSQRNGILCVLLVLLLCSVASFVYWEAFPVDKGFRDARPKLRGVKTLTEVNDILGPPGDYSTKPRAYIGLEGHSGPFPTGNSCTWIDDYAFIMVYSRDGYVSYCAVMEVTPNYRPWVDGLLRP